MTSHSLTQADLANFTGSTEHYVHPLFRYRYTEGVRHVADRGGAWWLLDAIASWQPKLRRRGGADFQVWTLRRTPHTGKDSAELLCTDGNHRRLARQRIAYTDFPLHEIQMYFIDGIMLLPSEY